MARARNIKPGFFKNADLLDLPFEARLLFIGLWTLADRCGRLEDRPKQIKVEIFPGDNVDCEACIASLAAIHMLHRYEHGGRRYLEITNFVKHQNPHCKEPVVFPPPPGANSIATKQAPERHDASTKEEPNKPGASPVQANGEYEEKTMRATLNPESLLLNPETPLLNPESKNTDTPSLPRDPPSEFSGATKPGAVCVVLKSEGIAQVNPGHADLLELLESGAQLTDFVAACEIANGANKPHFGYVLGIVRRRLEDARKPAKKRQKNASNAERETETFRERDERKLRKNWEEMTGRQHPDTLAELAAESAAQNAGQIDAGQDPKTVTMGGAGKPATLLPAKVGATA